MPASASPAAALVWDGGDIIVPTALGTPASNQLQGTVAEQLSEIAGRTCYDSLGVDPDTGKPRGRSSAKFHEHIQEVQHFSVYEHFNFTVEIPEHTHYHVYSLLNRPGLWLEAAGNSLQITLNLRTLLEWERYNCPLNTRYPDFSRTLHRRLLEWGHQLAPQVIPRPDYPAITPQIDHYQWSLVPPSDLREHQAWIALYMTGTRGWSHEQVRHGNETGISQRSTRYVDESDSAYLLHPLLRQYLEESSGADTTADLLDQVETITKQTYDTLVPRLQEFIISKGITDKTTARKQARGAARNVLCMALPTEMIFSGSAGQWQWMLQQRCSGPADAEIRVIFNDVLPALQASRYGHYFRQYKLIPAPDGLGQVLA